MQAFDNVILKGGTAPADKGGGCVFAWNSGPATGDASTVFNLGFDGTSFQGCAATGAGKGGALEMMDAVTATFTNMKYSGNTPDDIMTSVALGSTSPAVTCTSAPTSCSDVVTKDTADKCEALAFPAITAGDAIKTAVEDDDKCKSCAGTASNCKASCSDTNGVTATATAADSTDCGSYAVKTSTSRLRG